MKTKDLIKILEQIDKEGDCNIYIASDSECNSLSTMDEEYSIGYDFNAKNNKKFIILTPFTEGLVYDELE